MTVEIKKGRAVGKIAAPPSKSMAHRNLICGAFSKKSIITSVHMSKDIEATLSCLRGLGAQVQTEGDCVTVGGLDTDGVPAENSIFCNESGSTLRFMIPICLLFEHDITLRGTRRLFQRSLDIYEELCRDRGLLFEMGEDYVRLRGPIQSGTYEIKGDVSSQFISGLLFALPHCKGESVIKIKGDFESASYVDLTLSALRRFGIEISRPDEKTFVIKGEQRFIGTSEAVEGDYSNAAFFEALNRIGGSVEISGLKADSMQGDRVYGELFDRIEKADLPIDISDCPDLGPILFAYSAVCGRGEFVGTRRLRIKESDRAWAMKTELEKLGAVVSVGENSVSISCDGLMTPTEPISAHNDHRIVMSMAVLSTLTGGIIEGAEAVSKSFPDFFDRLSSLGIEVNKK